MCGIALILSEAAVPASLRGEGSLASETEGPRDSQVDGPARLVDDLKAALIRRGPDSIGDQKVFLQLSWDCAVDEADLSISREESYKNVVHTDVQKIAPQMVEKERGLMTSVARFSCVVGGSDRVAMSNLELHFLGATLQLRGLSPVSQPLADDSGNILLYNGEIFGGIHVERKENDGETLLRALGKCSVSEDNLCCKEELSVPHILSSIRGPWALIYWQAKTNTIWFGRDAFGRRSLLVHWPTDDDPQFVLSSVSPVQSDRGLSGTDLQHQQKTALNLMDCKMMLEHTPYWDELSCGIYSVCLENMDLQHQQKTALNLMDCKMMLEHTPYWDELSCGIYSVCLENKKKMSLGTFCTLFNGVAKHEWRNPFLKELIKWDRRFVDPCVLNRNEHSLPFQPAKHFRSVPKEVQSKQIKVDAGKSCPAHKVLAALRESVMRRTILNSTLQNDPCQILQPKTYTPFAVLFSGGLDSMIIAALLDQCLSQEYAIDLLNVSFDGSLAPDRISARAGLKELQNIAPSRRWKLVEIDADLSNLSSETNHVMSLINPARTYMDLNIGISLWLAAGGEGFVDGETCNPPEGSHRYKYKSAARILLVGSGADEQCAGYGRHRTKFRNGGWSSLQEEMRLDMQRIWIRNMGRDDRLLSDHGKEARFPFLDEDVVKTLLEIPLWDIAELHEPAGRGDKKILREVARLLSLEQASVLPKRAIQFGSRIARESNKMHFGSNRAANQASAGTVVISKPPP